MKKIISLAFIILISFSTIAFAANEEKAVKVIENPDLSAYRSIKEIEKIDIKVPTVVELPIKEDFLYTNNFAVLEKETNIFQANYFYSRTKEKEISTSYNIGDFKLNDSNFETYVNFDLPETGHGNVNIIINSTENIKSDSLTFSLSKNVALPINAEIKAIVNGKEKIIFAKERVNSTTINFPETIAQTWYINFEYAQPLRINELKLNQKDPDNSETNGLRFLARPDMTYKIYLNPDHSVYIPTSESADLRSNQGIKTISSVKSQDNPIYKKADTDYDGIPDEIDNCVSIANTDQTDIDENSRGDACDDFDKDQIINQNDNCIDQPNTSQIDTDKDGIGDACDTEESRITESKPWLPWLGMGFVAFVILFLFISVLREKK